MICFRPGFEGVMLVHPNPNLDGKNLMDLNDLNGIALTKVLIEAPLEINLGPFACPE
jgi:hypothetical protein